MARRTKPKAKTSRRSGAGTSSAEAYEQLLARAERGKYVLRLYVSGMTPRSQRAIDNIKALCEQHLAGHYTLEIVDIYQKPEAARAEQILAAPTLLKRLPLPLRRILGDLSQPDRVLVGLGLKLEGTEDAAP